MSNGFYTVRILRKSEQCVASVCLQEFFKFCGVYVWEYVMDSTEHQNDVEKADVNLLLADSDMKNETYPEASMVYLMDLSQVKSLGDFNNFFPNEAKDFFSKLIECELLPQKYQDSFEQLVSIFQEYDYAAKNYTKHCISAQMSKDELLKLAQMFYDCYESLNRLNKNLRESDRQSPYVVFAMLNCARKVNDCCEIRGNIPLFKTEVLAKEAADIRELDGKFSMGDVLCGIFGIQNTSYSDEKLSHMKKLEELHKNKRSGLFVLYLIGHYFEMDRRDPETGWEYYSSILETDPHNYRAQFKRGCREMRNKNYEIAQKEFETIIEGMKKKDDSGFIQPIELEYWYKCLLFCIKIQLTHYRDSACAARLRAESDIVKNRKFTESAFTNAFFEKNDIEKYAEYLRKRMERYQI